MSILKDIQYVVLLLHSILILFGSQLYSQTTPNIEGKVINTDKQPIQGATVELVEKNQSTLTDENGMFHFIVPDGIYTIRISMVKYESKTIEANFSHNTLPLFTLEEKANELGEVVITATRTEKNIADIPLPITIIDKKEIQQKLMVRLDEVLAEQPGIILVEDHGTGIQLQGFDAKYTMILIDGEPVIGRTSGTLDLSRITMDNVERVEILKGPSSSLYGSEAMAGVVNIITKKPAKGNQIGSSVRYGTNNSLDVSLDGSVVGKKTSMYGAFNRFSSSGYTYGKNNASKTVPPFYGYTGNVNIYYNPITKLDLKLGIKYNDENARDHYITNTGKNDQYVSSKFLRRDIAITPSIAYHYSDKHTTFLRLNQSFYKTDTRINVIKDGSLYNHDYFDQNFSRAELQHDYKVNKKVHITVGTGISDEWLKAVRYDDKKEFVAGFGYAQADMKFFDRLNLIVGGRFDVHSVYTSQFSPKLSAQYKTLSWLSIYASIGSGYKAPDFRELYLNWTNPTQGYSVFGTEDAAYKLKQLVEAGEIAKVLYDTSLIKKLDAERSWNYQAGIKLNPITGFDIEFNLFRNHVTNLIETFIIATKTNGKPVYTYSNQANVIIQGSEGNIAYKWKNIDLKVGVQYLYTANKDVLDAINEGKGYYTRDATTGISRLVKSSEYGGLFKRSRYTANTSITYNLTKQKIFLTFRWAYRNRFGMRDIDGNGILNLNEEYAPGYSLFNASVVKLLLKNRLNISLSTENLGNITNTGISTMPGRQFFIGIIYQSKKIIN